MEIGILCYFISKCDISKNFRARRGEFAGKAGETHPVVTLAGGSGTRPYGVTKVRALHGRSGIRNGSRYFSTYF
jgi:hypothetical protein